MLLHLTTLVTIHTIAALLAITVGAVQLIRPKHGPAHRARGYAFVYGMVVVDGAAMLLYRFTGGFNAFHVGAIVNLVAIVCAMVPMLMSPRPAQWRQLHYHFMGWGFVGLMAAAVTELVVRSTALPHGAAWAVSAAATGLVTLIGAIMIRRYRPPLASRDMQMMAAIQNGRTP
jgi:uncharacterized membrane protein